MSKTLKMVFVAFTQHCKQSTVTHLTHVEDALQGGRLFISAFCPVGLVVHHQSVQGGSFVKFLELSW